MVPRSDVPIVVESPLIPAHVLMPPAPERLPRGQVEEPQRQMEEAADLEALDPAAEAFLWFG